MSVISRGLNPAYVSPDATLIERLVFQVLDDVLTCEKTSLCPDCRFLLIHELANRLRKRYGFSPVEQWSEDWKPRPPHLEAPHPCLHGLKEVMVRIQPNASRTRLISPVVITDSGGEHRCDGLDILGPSSLIQKQTRVILQTESDLRRHVSEDGSDE